MIYIIIIVLLKLECYFFLSVFAVRLFYDNCDHLHFAVGFAIARDALEIFILLCICVILAYELLRQFTGKLQYTIKQIRFKR
jgi:hypothetical protein